MTAGITATQLVFSPSYFVGIQAAKAYASAMEASESKSSPMRAARQAKLRCSLGCRRKCGILKEARSLASAALTKPVRWSRGLAESTDADQLELALSEMPSNAPLPKAWPHVASTPSNSPWACPSKPRSSLADNFETPVCGFTGSLCFGHPFQAVARNYSLNPKTSSSQNSAFAMKKQQACPALAPSTPTNATPSATLLTSSKRQLVPHPSSSGFK